MNSKNRVPNALIGIAGVHYVVSELSRRGLVAMATIRNTAGIDVLVTEPDGSAQAVLQVKTASRIKIQEEGRQWWWTSKPSGCLGPNAFYVFVRYDQDKEKFEGFLVSAADVANQIDGKFWGLPKCHSAQKTLADHWKTWRPPKASSP